MITNDVRARIAASALAFTAATVALAQDPPAAGTALADTMVVVTGPAPALPLGGAVDVLGGQGSVVGGVIAGKPYSAESITESVQILADGNRIVHTNEARLYRDSLGRTRREQSLAALGPWRAGADPVSIVVIDDPVERVSYVLDPQAQTARVVQQFRLEPTVVNAAVADAEGNVTFAVPPEAGAAAPEGARPNVVMRRFGPAPLPGPQGEPAPFALPLAEPAFGLFGAAQPIGATQTTENLGEQVLEGVLARGVRETTTIPAGAIGNERPIESTTEQWYSEELGALLLRRTFDPRFGETVYRLVSVTRSEPAPELFQVPSGYRTLENARARAEESGFVPAVPAEPGRRVERRVLFFNSEQAPQQ